MWRYVYGCTMYNIIIMSVVVAGAPIMSTDCARRIEISKGLDMHLFLFDDILLLTRVKKASRKVCG